MPRPTLHAALRRLVPAFAAVVLIAGSASAQDMTSADVTRLQQSVDQIGSDLAKLRTTDRTAASAMQNELTALQEEVTSLKVQLRKERVVSRSDYMDVRDRLEDLRSRVNARAATRAATAAGRAAAIRPSSVIDVDTAVYSVGHRDRRGSGRRSSPITRLRIASKARRSSTRGERRVRPRRACVRGGHRSAERPRRSAGSCHQPDEITLDGRHQLIRGSVTQALRRRLQEDAGKIAPAPRWAHSGGILADSRVRRRRLIGGGGVVAATEGKDASVAGHRAACASTSRACPRSAEHTGHRRRRNIPDDGGAIRRSNAKGALRAPYCLCVGLEHCGPRGDDGALVSRKI